MTDPNAGRYGDPEAGSGIDDVDEIDAGGSILPAWLAEFGRRSDVRWAARCAVAVTVAAIIVTVGSTTVARRSVTNGIGQTRPALSTTPTPFDRVLALVRQKSLSNNIRQASEAGACAQVPVGYSPDGAVLALVRQLAPGAKETDQARTIDQFTGLCALVVRAVAPGGVQVVVAISAPPPHPAPNTLDAVEVGLENAGANTTVEYVLENVHTGWVVLIGAVGSNADLPRTIDLAAAADAQQMRW